MTKTTAEKIAVMQAYERGEKIELRAKNSSEGWGSAIEPLWDWYSADYRIAAPDPIPHTIDWSHVAEGFDWLFTSSVGENIFLLTNVEPKKDSHGFYIDGDEKNYAIAVSAKSHASFKAGNMPWQDSLVVRPVDEKK